MVYNLKTHKWELTEEDVLDELGYNLTAQLGDIKLIPLFLKEVSYDVYNWAYRNGLRRNRPIIEYNFALNSIYLEDLKDAMLAQVRYVLRSRGAHLLKDQMLLDLESGQAIDRHLAAERTIGLEVEFYINSTGLVKHVPLPSNIPSDITRGVDY